MSVNISVIPTACYLERYTIICGKTYKLYNVIRENSIKLSVTRNCCPPVPGTRKFWMGNWYKHFRNLQTGDHTDWCNLLHTWLPRIHSAWWGSGIFPWQHFDQLWLVETSNNIPDVSKVSLTSAGTRIKGPEDLQFLLNNITVARTTQQQQVLNSSWNASSFIYLSTYKALSEMILYST